MKNQFLYVDTIEQELFEEMGSFQFLQAIIRALDYDTKQEIYEYIARCYDISISAEVIEENE